MILIPVALSIHPENHMLNVIQFLKSLQKFNLSVYEYKIASVANMYQDNSKIRKTASLIIHGLQGLSLSKNPDGTQKFIITDAVIPGTKVLSNEQ